MLHASLRQITEQIITALQFYAVSEWHKACGPFKPSTRSSWWRNLLWVVFSLFLCSFVRVAFLLALYILLRRSSACNIAVDFSKHKWSLQKSWALSQESCALFVTLTYMAASRSAHNIIIIINIAYGSLLWTQIKSIIFSSIAQESSPVIVASRTDLKAAQLELTHKTHAIGGCATRRTVTRIAHFRSREHA